MIAVQSIPRATARQAKVNNSHLQLRETECVSNTDFGSSKLQQGMGQPLFLSGMTAITLVILTISPSSSYLHASSWLVNRFVGKFGEDFNLPVGLANR